MTITNEEREEWVRRKMCLFKEMRDILETARRTILDNDITEADLLGVIRGIIEDNEYEDITEDKINNLYQILKDDENLTK